MSSTHVHYSRTHYSLTSFERDARDTNNIVQTVHILTRQQAVHPQCRLALLFEGYDKSYRKLFVHNTPLHNSHILQTSPTDIEYSHSFQQVDFCSMLIKTFQIINEFQLFFLCNLLVVIQTRVTKNTPIQAHLK
jgi:hypothetical protein